MKLYCSQGTGPGNEGHFKSRNEIEMKKWEMKLEEMKRNDLYDT